MSKGINLSPEEKIWLVEQYKAGQISTSEFERKYGSNRRVLFDWIRVYEIRGIEGLLPVKQSKKYSQETKLLAVRDYMDGVGSLNAICTKYDITCRKSLRQWIKMYNDRKGYRQSNSGGAIYMVKGRKATLEERIEIVSYCIANNKDYGKTIEKFNVSYQQIYGWVRKYEEDAAEGLVDRRGKRKDKAFMSEVERLRAQLKLKEAENLKLQMENELLKKLEALERGQDVY